MRKKIQPKKSKEAKSRRRIIIARKSPKAPVERALMTAKWFYRHINLCILLLSAVALMMIVFTVAPQRRGDGTEYYQMMISLAGHGTPDLRESDIANYNRLRAETAKNSKSFKQDVIANVNPSNGYVLADSGKAYSIHFWFYSLSAIPAKWFLQASGLDELKAFQITNALFVIFALYVVLFHSGFDKYKKWLFATLVLFCPALWYLGWPNPEIFSYSLVVASIAFFTGKKQYLAVLCASIASTQNPPIIFLVIFFLIYGLIDVLHDKRWAKAWLLMASASPALAPMVFYYLNFGSPSLIYRVGEASFSVISFQRTMNFFFDLNQGILPYLPGVLIFFTFLIFRNWKQREWRVYELSVIIAFMVLLAQTTTNWNSDAEGIMRYAVWMLPLFIWGAVEGANISLKSDRIMLGLVLVVQLIIVFSFPSWFNAKYIENNYLASYLLDNHPSLYNPVPEIFAERTLGKEVMYEQVDYLPVIYFKSDGTVTKIMTDYAGLVELSRYGDIDAGFHQKQKDLHRGKKGIFYIDLSHGEMRLRLSTNR
ncbi:MAG: hypothetical protein ACYC4D_03665 [Thermoleophilia bacterium]